MFRAFQKDFGTIDRVIINAGIGKDDRPLREGSPLTGGTWRHSQVP